VNLAQARISESVLVFDGSYPGGGNVTATVVHSEREAFVFDSLLYPRDTRELLYTLKEMNLKIKGLVNTHWHVDHTAGNQFFLEAERIISHSLCPDLMRSDDLGWLNKNLIEEDKVIHSYPNESIEDGAILRAGDRNGVEILHTPGHTPDSIIGWLKEQDVVIAGDTVMELPFVGYGDSRALMESLKEVHQISKDGSRIIQGHGGLCDVKKLDSDMSYIEDLRKRTAEYVVSGRTVEQASADIKLEDCVTRERFQYLSKGFGSILWCHPENVRRVYSELEVRRA
jgi:cyclase